MFFEYLGLKLIGGTLQGTASLLRGVGKLCGVSEEDLEYDKIKAQRAYSREARSLQEDRRFERRRFLDGEAARRQGKAEMRKRAYDRVLKDEEEE